uniref:hypothetical protein n=1 Tax=Helicobacter pylori TaxID=210 RepID=UPI0018ACD552
NTTNKIKNAKTTIKKSNLKPQSLGKEKDLLKTWQRRDALLASFMNREDFKQPFIGLEHAKLNQQNNQTPINHLNKQNNESIMK